MPGDDWKPTVPERPSSRSSREAIEPAEPTSSTRYVPGEEIARGGMGRVIEATDTVLARTVAVKEALTRDPETLRRFARETRITARLEHPSIVPVYDAGTDPDAPFYVMRRVSGRPLSGLIAGAASLDERLALIPHVLACAQAIAHAHKRGVIHRDIKPNNILVGELGETVVIDWGIAKVIGENEPDDDLPPMAGDSLRTRIGTVSGTPGFMSPEQARGDELGPSADVWALGATLYYLLARQMPHEIHAKTPDELLSYAAHRKVPSIASIVAGVPPELAAITDRALAFEAADRFPDAATFAEELSRFLTGQIVASHRYSWRERLVRWVKRNRALVAVAIVAVTVVAVMSTIAIRNIVLARQRADENARLAETARAKEQAHAQGELIARARAIAATHPTAAIAAIDQLPASSPFTAEAETIFKTAISHGGAAWGLARNSSQVVMLELDPSASKLLQLTRDAVLQVWDLDRRALLWSRTLGERQYAMWTARGVLIFGDDPARIIDLANHEVAFGQDALYDVAVSDDGTTISARDGKGFAGWIDLATGTLTRVTPEPVDSIAMPRDGSWFATGRKGEVAVYDRSGAAIQRLPGDRPILLASASKHLAMFDNGSMFETTVGPGATWEPRETAGIIWPEYFGETLGGRSPSTLFTFGERSKKPIAIRQLGGIEGATSAAGSGTLGFTSGGAAGDLFYFDAVRTFTIPLPEAFAKPRVAGRRGSTRVAIASNSTLIVLDLRYLLPRRRLDLEAHKAQYVSDDDIMFLGDGGSWTLVRGTKRITLDAIAPHSDLVDVSRGRVLFSYPPLVPVNLSMLDLSRMEVWTAAAQGGVLVDGGLVYIAERKLMVRPDGAAEGHEIAELASPDAAIVNEGAQVWVFSNGEVLHGTVANGIIDRKPYTLPDRGALIPYQGRFLVADKKELHWDSVTGPLAATIEDTIVAMYRVPGGVVGTLSSGMTLYLAIAADHTVTTHHLSTVTLSAHNDTGRIIAPSSTGTEIIELPSRLRWSHPVENPLPNSVSMPPNGRSVLQLGADAQWWEWTMPPAGEDLATIRNLATNAREQDDHVLVWPWQTSR